MKFRYELINFLISKYGYKSYLEIGIDNGVNFAEIKIDKKDGVDPAGKCNYIMTSDDFFKNISAEQTYDIVFIDGLHLKEQVLKDVYNSLNHLSDNGTIVMHDCNPIEKYRASPEIHDGKWNGTVWEAFVELRMTRSDISMIVLDMDFGCGIIRKGNQKLIPTQILSYSLLEKNRKLFLNLTSVKEFLSNGAKL